MRRMLVVVGAAVTLGCGEDGGTPPVTQRDFSRYVPPGSEAVGVRTSDGRCIVNAHFRLFSDRRFREIREYRTCVIPGTALGSDTVTGRQVATAGRYVHVFDGGVTRADTALFSAMGAVEDIAIETHYEPNVNGRTLWYSRGLP